MEDEDESKYKGTFLQFLKAGEPVYIYPPFLLNDAHGVSQRLRYSNSGSYSLDKSMSAIDLQRTKAFPENIEFDVLLTFKGNPSGNLVRSVTPTATNLTVNQHHSFVKLPDNNYNKRKFDPRSGSIEKQKKYRVRIDCFPQEE